MSRASRESSLTLAGLLRILFRWKRPALLVFFGLLIAGGAVALYWPLSYESQVILERKPVKVTPVVSRQEDEDFDVYRLTSESQRGSALLKSRYMMERWMAALGWQPETPLQMEKALRRLEHSLTVQPVSYTDLFIVKVRAASPDEARHRAGVLVDSFNQWDEEQNRMEADSLRRLLESRLGAVNQVLSSQWARLKNEKGTQSLSLSGSAQTKQLENDIAAEGKVYDRISAELEEADRRIQNDELLRTRILAPPSTPGKPILSLVMRWVLVAFASALAAFGFVFLLEWQDGTLRRTQDIVHEIPDYPVLTVPVWHNGHDAAASVNYLGLLADAVGEQVRSKGTMLVQFVSPSEGDGKSTVSAALAGLLSTDFKVCVVHQTAVKQLNALRPLPLPAADGGVKTLDMSVAEPLSKQLVPLRKIFNLFILDTDSLPNSSPGNNLLQEADLICILLAAGRTSRHFLRALRHHLQRFRGPNILFILNRYDDPLPAWLQSN